MAIKYFDTPDGYFVNLYGRLGCIEATIHRPNKAEGLKEWRLCFATCTGEAYDLRGKVRDRKTLAAIKHDLEGYDRTLNAPQGNPIPGFRGLPLDGSTPSA